MSTKENRSVAYIYNEMDPSEKLEFERDLNSDNDLLIEVESFRKIKNDLKQLEHINPPDHIVQAVYESARNNSAKSSNSHWKIFFYSAAAILLIGVTSGIFMMDDQQADAANDQTESASITATPAFSQPVSSSSAESLTPWVDKNEILYLQGQVGSGNQAVNDSIRHDSFKKLTPVTDPAQVRPYVGLQLTGSRN